MFKMLFTIVLPIVILLTLSGDDRLGPIPALLFSLAFPIGYGTWEFRRSRTFDTTAMVGIVSTLLTGVIGVFELSPQLFAVKEAAVPILFAALIVISQYTRMPIVRLLFDQTIHKQQVYDAVASRNTNLEMAQLMTRTSWLWAGTMVMSGIMRYALAEIVVTSEPGTPAFNHELGLMNLLRLPTVTVATMVLMIGTIAYLVRSTARVTGLAPREFFRGGDRLARMLDRG
jgi:hypothetical protein